jgi:arylsulfatase
MEIAEPPLKGCRGMFRRDVPDSPAAQGANTYHDWMIDRGYVLGPMQAIASKFLLTMKEYPPSQTPGDWSLATPENQIKSMTADGK